MRPQTEPLKMDRKDRTPSTRDYSPRRLLLEKRLAVPTSALPEEMSRKSSVCDNIGSPGKTDVIKASDAPEGDWTSERMKPSNDEKRRSFPQKRSARLARSHYAAHSPRYADFPYAHRGRWLDGPRSPPSVTQQN